MQEYGFLHALHIGSICGFNGHFIHCQGIPHNLVFNQQTTYNQHYQEYWDLLLLNLEKTELEFNRVGEIMRYSGENLNPRAQECELVSDFYNFLSL